MGCMATNVTELRTSRSFSLKFSSSIQNNFGDGLYFVTGEQTLTLPVELFWTNGTCECLWFLMFLLMMPQVRPTGSDVLALMTDVFNVLMLTFYVPLQLILRYGPVVALITVKRSVSYRKIRQNALYLLQISSSDAHPSHHAFFLYCWFLCSSLSLSFSYSSIAWFAEL